VVRWTGADRGDGVPTTNAMESTASVPSPARWAIHGDDSFLEMQFQSGQLGKLLVCSTLSVRGWAGKGAKKKERRSTLQTTQSSWHQMPSGQQLSPFRLSQEPGTDSRARGKGRKGQTGAGRLTSAMTTTADSGGWSMLIQCQYRSI
jgi:hypothetical protein